MAQNPCTNHAPTRPLFSHIGHTYSEDFAQRTPSRFWHYPSNDTSKIIHSFWWILRLGVQPQRSISTPRSWTYRGWLSEKCRPTYALSISRWAALPRTSATLGAIASINTETISQHFHSNSPILACTVHLSPPHHPLMRCPLSIGTPRDDQCCTKIDSHLETIKPPCHLSCARNTAIPPGRRR